MSDRQTMWVYDKWVYSERFVQRGEICGAIVEVVYVEYLGGGEGYEFYLGIDQGTHLEVSKSDNGYGNATAALIDGYIYAVSDLLPGCGLAVS